MERKTSLVSPSLLDHFRRTFVFLGMLGLAGIVVALCFFRVGNGDFWTHLKTGQWIAEHRAVPRENLYMYTAPGYPWINHTWLTALTFYTLYCIGGLHAVQISEMLLISCSFAVLFLLHRKAGVPVFLSIILFALGIATARARYDLRPEMFSGLLVSVFLFLLCRYKCGHNRSLWLTLPIVCIWTDFHGTVLTSTVVLFLLAFGEAVQYFLQRRGVLAADATVSPERIRHVVLIALLSVAAMCVNPYGLGYFAALRPERLSLLNKYLVEWQPLGGFLVDFDWTTHAIMLIFFGMIVSSFFFARKQFSISALLLFVVFCLLTIRSSRNIWMLVQVSLCVAALNFSAFSSRNTSTNASGLRGEFLQVVAPVGSLLVVIGIVCQAVYFSFACGYTYGFGVDTEAVPVGTVGFLRKHNIKGVLFNDELDSGFLSWTLYPRQKLFIDAMNAYGEEMFRAAQELRGKDIESRILDRWGFEICLVPNKSYFQGLLQSLRSRSDWALVYWDGISWLFVRRINRFTRIIEQTEYRTVKGLGLDRGLLPASDALANEVRRALRTAPPTASLNVQCGRILLANGSYAAAEQCFQNALVMRPHCFPAMLGLAEIYRLRGDYRLSISMCRRVLFFQRRSAEALRIMGLSYLQLRDAPRDRVRGVRLLEEAMRTGRHDYEMDENLSLAYIELGRLAEAERTLERMLLTKPTSVPSLYALAVVLANQGHKSRERILDCLRKAVALQPGVRNLIQNDRSFDFLRDDPAFQTIASGQAAAGSTPRAKGMLSE